MWKGFVQVCIWIWERIWASKQEILFCKLQYQTHLDTYRNDHKLVFVYRTVTAFIERLHSGRALWKLLWRASDILHQEHFSLLGVFSLVGVSTFSCCSCASAFLKNAFRQWSSILLYMQQRELLSLWKNGQKVNVCSIVIKPREVGHRGFKANVGTWGD